MATRLEQIATRLARLEAMQAPATVHLWCDANTEATIAALPPGTPVIVFRWADAGEGHWREPAEPIVPAASGTPLRP